MDFINYLHKLKTIRSCNGYDNENKILYLNDMYKDDSHNFVWESKNYIYIFLFYSYNVEELRSD